jgi:hypothetical protein
MVLRRWHLGKIEGPKMHHFAGHKPVHKVMIIGGGDRDSQTLRILCRLESGGEQLWGCHVHECRQAVPREPL